MKVIQAHTGAPCVPVPSKGVIFVDPALNHDTVVKLIQASMPRAHPDAINHWVERMLPTAGPLAAPGSFIEPRAAGRKPGAHRGTDPRSH